MSEQLYYIWSGGYSGDALIWWGKDSRGYTSNLDNAGKYTKDEAKRICSNSDRREMAFPVEYIDGNAHRAVWQSHIDFNKKL